MDPSGCYGTDVDGMSVETIPPLLAMHCHALNLYSLINLSAVSTPPILNSFVVVVNHLWTISLNVLLFSTRVASLRNTGLPPSQLDAT